MPRITLVSLEVTGTGKAAARVQFAPNLTLISGFSNTGKTHVLECVDFVLGASSPPREIPEADGYTDLALEMSHGEDRWTISRRLPAPDDVIVYQGPIAAWDGEEGTTLKVDITGDNDPAKTLSGFLLNLAAFDASMPIVKNQRGKTQRLSFRTAIPFALVKEPEVIDTQSPVAPRSAAGPTIARSLFRILLTGEAPTPEEIQKLQDQHEERDRAKQESLLLGELIENVRDEVTKANLSRADLQDELARIDDELATVSETVAESGERVRKLLQLRNDAIRSADTAAADLRTAEELLERFSLLGDHYRSDISRLDFVVEGGHFFNQIEPTSCPTCGRPWIGDDQCHTDPDFAAIERAAFAERRKLRPRLVDLEQAMADARSGSQQARARRDRERSKAAALDHEIKEVANPSASTARARVQALGKRRRKVEDQLLHFRDLDRYTVLLQTAEATAKTKVDTYRPEQTATSLVSLAEHVKSLLVRWKLPGVTDVRFSVDHDDLVINGKQRSANGKGVLAVTHAAFNIGLLHHCIEQATPHPGFVVVDTPLTHFKGPTDDEEDPAMSRDLHTAFLHSLADHELPGQVVVIENVPPPSALAETARVHWFSGPDGEGRQGFYPTNATNA